MVDPTELPRIRPVPWWYDVIESFVVRVGFPAAVAGFVLIKLDATMQELTKAVVNLSHMMRDCPR